MTETIGTHIKFRYTLWAGEQGQLYPSEWTNIDSGLIVGEKKSRWLVELKDGARKWIDKSDVVHDSPKLPEDHTVDSLDPMVKQMLYNFTDTSIY